MYSQDSIDLLQNSGLQFKKHEEEGIDTLYFAELLMTSGLVLCENVKWLSFHRSVLFWSLSGPISVFSVTGQTRIVSSQVVSSNNSDI